METGVDVAVTAPTAVVVAASSVTGSAIAYPPYCTEPSSVDDPVKRYAG